VNYNQNQRLNQLDEKILIIGVDVSKKFQVVIAQASEELSSKSELNLIIHWRDFSSFVSGKPLC